MAQESLSSSPVTQPDSKMANNHNLSSVKDAQLAALQARQAALEETISQLQSQRSALVNSHFSHSTIQDFDSEDSEATEDARARVALDYANAKIKFQISQLQEYNDIKDIGTQLMGLIAEKRGCRIFEVQEEYGIDAED